ncbi:cytochrome P450 [Sphaerosporella brunnea]|uniref:Cytochrome P450 n=1 Tax=Sphaerosporella brunnea TaxID=1250544 RepID=A0A5J5F0F4_9PEZI|nr:cytochrome P450 [Sphaerosporella brunnea]
MWSIASTLLLAVLSYWVLTVLYKLFLSPLSRIPGPWYTALTSLWLKPYTLSGRRHHIVHSLHQRYGPIVRLTPTQISIIDPTATCEIYSSTGNYQKSRFYEIMGAMSRVQMFVMTDPIEARWRRKLLSGGFSLGSLKSFDGVVARKVDAAIGKMVQVARKEGVVDMYLWWYLMATDLIMMFGFGGEYQMLEKGEVTSYITDMKTLTMLMGLRGEFPRLVKVLSKIPFSPLRLVPELIRRVESYGSQALQAFDGEELEFENGFKKATWFSQIIAEERRLKGKMDPRFRLEREDIEMEAASMIFGGELLYNPQIGLGAASLMLVVIGTDTVATTITYLIYTILKHPDIRDKLLDALEPLRKHDIATLVDSQLVKIPYLQMLVDEGLRLHPGIQGALPRSVPAGGRTLAGYYIPEGTSVESQNWTVHRDPKVFPEPERFWPERWENPTDEMKRMHMPFGGGHRSCLGMPLALMELRRATAIFFLKLGKNVELAPSTTDDSMEGLTFFTTTPKAGKCEIVIKGMEVTA